MNMLGKLAMVTFFALASLGCDEKKVDKPKPEANASKPAAGSPTLKPADKAPPTPTAPTGTAPPGLPVPGIVPPGGSAALPAGVDPELGEKMVELMEKMAGIVDANKDNCEKMATAVTAFVASNEDLLKKAKEAESKLSPEQKQAFMMKHAAHVQGAALKMAAGMGACQNNEAIMKAMQAIGR